MSTRTGPPSPASSSCAGRHRSAGQPRGHSPCSKDNRGRMSPRTRVSSSPARPPHLPPEAPLRWPWSPAGHEGGAEEADRPLAGRAAARPRPRRARRSRGARTAACPAPLLAEASVRGRADLRPLQSPEARIGAALRRLAGHEPGEARAPGPRAAGATRSCSSTSGFANLWAGQSAGGHDRVAGGRRGPTRLRLSAAGGRLCCTRTSRRASRSSCRAFGPPAGLGDLSPPAQFAALAREARRRDARAKLLYGLALQRLGHRLSARREYDAAAKLAPRDPEALVAAAVVRFDKSRPAEAFSRLGPLTRRFPGRRRCAFTSGCCSSGSPGRSPGSVEEGKRQLRLAQAEDPGSPLAAEAKRLLARLANEPKK